MCAFKIKKKTTEREKAIKQYGKDFVEKIESSEKNFKDEKYKIIKTEDLWKSLMTKCQLKKYFI